MAQMEDRTIASLREERKLVLLHRLFLLGDRR